MAHRIRNTCVRNGNWPCVLLMGLRAAVVDHSGESSGAGRARICLGERPRSGVSRVKSTTAFGGCLDWVSSSDEHSKESTSSVKIPIQTMLHEWGEGRDRPRALRSTGIGGMIPDQNEGGCLRLKGGCLRLGWVSAA